MFSFLNVLEIFYVIIKETFYFIILQTLGECYIWNILNQVVTFKKNVRQTSKMFQKNIP